METNTFNATNNAYFKNHLLGKSTIEQVKAVAAFADIIGDFFAFNYESPKFLEGTREERFELTSLRTAYHWFAHDLLQSLLESAATGENFDWSKVGFNDDVKELSYNFETYSKAVLATLSVFDWAFAHDSMKGGTNDDFYWKCLQVRDLLIDLITAALDKSPKSSIEVDTIIYPNCEESGPDAESVYQ